MVSNDWQQIPETALYPLDLLREFRQPCRKFREPLRFERSVDNDATAFPECITQRSDELASGIVAVGRQEFVVFGFDTGVSLHVDRPLKRQLIEWTHSREPWDCWIYALKVHEIERVIQAPQILAQFLTEPRVACLHGGARSPLPFTERKVIGYVGDGLNAQFLQFLGGTGMESGQIPDVVVWERRIAAVEKLARDWIGAMRPSWNFGRVRHRKDAKFRP